LTSTRERERDKRGRKELTGTTVLCLTLVLVLVFKVGITALTSASCEMLSFDAAPSDSTGSSSIWVSSKVRLAGEAGIERGG